MVWATALLLLLLLHRALLLLEMAVRKGLKIRPEVYCFG